MEIHLLAIQARVLLIVGLSYIGLGLWLGTDPTVLAWRAVLAAVLAMVVVRWLLNQVALVIEERAATELAERTLAAEQAATTPQPAVQARPARRGETK
ncbi:MAG: hypothetical protein AAB263_14200 [Planctomycetota bacterium]